MSLNNLASTYRALGKAQQALAYFQKAYEIRKACLGEEHEHTEASLADMRETEEALAKQEGVSPDTKAQIPQGRE
ncbi:MAG: tetratricopeptide repeat protein [Bacteroidota bacterium]